MGSPVFTPSVLAAQKAFGSRIGAPSFPAVLTPALMDFVSERNSAYLATANAAGLPTIQHRGGPPGFIRKIDGRTIGFADRRGNGQLISYGNISENPQACLFLMDYENRWRVKIWGEARIDTSLELLARLTPESCSGTAQCSLLLSITGWDDNCSRHIPAKIDAARVNARIAALEARISTLERENATLTNRDGGSHA